jgi:hypothetical protein
MSSRTPGMTFFFCTGAAKSGTTLLARVLDQNPDIACLWESYAFMPRSSASIFNPASNSWKRHGFAREDVQRWASIWNSQPRALLRRALNRFIGPQFLVGSSFRQTMPEALVDFARRCNATVVGDKWPWYVDYLDRVLEVFPDAKLIYNTRDPRGLWNSAQRFKGRNRGDELLERMLHQARRMMPYLQRENSITIRYEDLVNRPEETSRRLHAFLGSKFSPRCLSYDRNADPYPDRWHWIPEASQQFDPWHAVKWKEQMDPRDIARVTELARWFIQEYGYEG